MAIEFRCKTELKFKPSKIC